MIIKRLWIALFLSLLVLPLTALDIEFPLIQSFAYFPFTVHTFAQPKKFTFWFQAANVNIFASDFDRSYVNDMEYTSFSLCLRYGLSQRLTLEANGRISLLQGGYFDRTIEKFHSAFGLPMARRDEFPRNEVNYHFKNFYNYSESQSWVSPLVLSILADIGRWGNFSLAGRFSLGIPLQSKSGLASGQPFLSSGVTAAFKKSSFFAEISGYIAFFPKPSWLKQEDLRHSLSLLEVKAGYNRFAVGYICKTSPFVTGDPSHAGNLFFLEYKIGKHFTIGLSEDYYPFDTTPDVGFYFRITD